MYLLDTNVISEHMKQRPDPGVLSWVEENEGLCYLPANAVEEMRYGIERMADGRRKDGYRRGLALVVDGYASKIVPFSLSAAWICGEMRGKAVAEGFNVSVQDCMIAAMAVSNRFQLVTRNVKDFLPLGIEPLNPFSS